MSPVAWRTSRATYSSRGGLPPWLLTSTSRRKPARATLARDVVDRPRRASPARASSCPAKARCSLLLPYASGGSTQSRSRPASSRSSARASDRLRRGSRSVASGRCGPCCSIDGDRHDDDRGVLLRQRRDVGRRAGTAGSAPAGNGWWTCAAASDGSVHQGTGQRRGIAHARAGEEGRDARREPRRGRAPRRACVIRRPSIRISPSTIDRVDVGARWPSTRGSRPGTRIGVQCGPSVRTTMRSARLPDLDRADEVVHAERLRAAERRHLEDLLAR